MRVLSPKDQHLPVTHTCVTSALSSHEGAAIGPRCGTSPGLCPGRLSWCAVSGGWGRGGGLATPSPKSWALREP